MVGDGVAVGFVDADALGVGDAGVRTVEPEMTQVPAADVHDVGAMKVPLSVIPMVADAPGAREAFHERLVAVRRPLARLPVAFHMLMLPPAHGMLTDHPVIGEALVFVTVRSTLRPLPQSEVTFTPTVSIALDAGAPVGAGLAVDAVVVGTGMIDGVGAGDDVELADAVGEGERGDSSADPSTTEQVPAGITQLVGMRVPPRGEPRNPKLVEAPGAREALQLGPVNLNPPTVAVLVASHTEVMELAYAMVTDHGLIGCPELLVMRAVP